MCWHVLLHGHLYNLQESSTVLLPLRFPLNNAIKDVWSLTCFCRKGIKRREEPKCLLEDFSEPKEFWRWFIDSSLHIWGNEDYQGPGLVYVTSHLYGQRSVVRAQVLTINLVSISVHGHFWVEYLSASLKVILGLSKQTKLQPLVFLLITSDPVHFLYQVYP